MRLCWICRNERLLITPNESKEEIIEIMMCFQNQDATDEQKSKWRKMCESMVGAAARGGDHWFYTSDLESGERYFYSGDDDSLVRFLKSEIGNQDEVQNILDQINNDETKIIQMVFQPCNN